MPHLYRPHEKTAPLTKGTTRWWYTNPTCGTSTTLHRPDVTLTQDFQIFHHYATNTLLLTHYTQKRHCLIKTLTRRFATFWLIPIPITTQPTRVYDQIFIDGTYLNGGCLLIAATTNASCSLALGEKRNHYCLYPPNTTNSPHHYA